MKYLCSLLLLFVSACDMIVPPWQLYALYRTARRPVVCAAGEDCKDKWARATEWVKTNAKYPIVMYTDRLIKTADSVSASPDAAFTISLVPAEGNIYTVHFDADCSDIFGCSPPLLKLKADFIHYVLDIQPRQ